MEQAAHLRREELVPAPGFGQRAAVEAAELTRDLLDPAALGRRELRGSPVPLEPRVRAPLFLFASVRIYKTEGLVNIY